MRGNALLKGSWRGFREPTSPNAVSSRPDGQSEARMIELLRVWKVYEESQGATTTKHPPLADIVLRESECTFEGK